jgi:esterase
MEVANLFSKIYGEGQPLIILHGLFGMSDNWTTHAKLFASKGWQVHAVDQRNHGRSPHMTEHSYEAMAADLEAYIDAHQLEKPVILGHSMGGKTVMNFAVRSPKQIRAAIVVDIAPKAYPIHHQIYIDAMRGVDFKESRSRKAVESALSSKLNSPGIIAFFMKSLYWKTKEELAWRFNLDALEQNLSMVGEPLEHGYFDAPALFIAGGASGYITEDDHDPILDLFPNAEIRTIEGAGHWVHAEAREAFARLVLEFLDTI